MSIINTLKRIKPVYILGHSIRLLIYKIKMSYLARNGYICSLKGKKALFYFPFIKTDEIQQSIFFSQKYYENEYLDYLCDKWHDGIIGKSVKNGTILDVGSNIGNHSLYFLLERGASYAYCFEPAKETFDILKKNMEINHLENCTKIFNAGVGASSGTASISMSKEKNTAYTQLSLNEEGDVKVIAIDDIGIKEKINFIKVDVEGFELEVLKGMIKTLEKDKPTMMIEIWTKNLHEIHSIMDPMGYQFELMEDRGYQADYICYVN